MIGNDGAADLHIHTCYSDGAASVQQVLDYVAIQTSLDVIAITDHDTIAGAEEAAALTERAHYPFEVIVGEEVSSRDGHIVGLFLHERVAPGLGAAETIAAIHAQGGLAFAPHPFFRARQSSADAITMVGLGAMVADLPFDAIETVNATPFLGPANRRAAAFNLWCSLPALGNSDGHILAAIGKGYTRFPDRSASDLRSAVRANRTAAVIRPYATQELLAYLRFWLRMTGGKLPLYLWPDRNPGGRALDAADEDRPAVTRR